MGANGRDFCPISVRDGSRWSLRCLLRVWEMPVIPIWKASLTLVLSLSHCVGRHLNDTKLAGVGDTEPLFGARNRHHRCNRLCISRLSLMPQNSRICGLMMSCRQYASFERRFVRIILYLSAGRCDTPYSVRRLEAGRCRLWLRSACPATTGCKGRTASGDPQRRATGSRG